MAGVDAIGTESKPLTGALVVPTAMNDLVLRREDFPVAELRGVTSVAA